MDSGYWANRVHKVREFGMAGRGLVGWDRGVALVVAVVQVIGGRGANFGQTGVRTLDVLGYTLLLAGPVALLFRRYQPYPVLLITLAVCVSYLSLDYGYGPIFLSLIIAFITAATRGSRWWTYPLVPLGYLLMVWPLPALLGRPTEGWQIFGLMAWLTVLVGLAEGIRQREAVLEARRQRAEAARRDEEAQRRRQASEERLAIARELHDVLAHSLSLINVQASVALELFDKKPDQAASALTAIKGASKDALAEVHTLLHTIRTGSPVGGEDVDTEPEATPDPDQRASRGRRRRARARRRRTTMPGAVPTPRSEASTVDGREQSPAEPEATEAPEQPAAPRSPAPSIADLDDLLHRIREAGLTVHTRVLGTVAPLPSVIDVAAARIIQESLTNVVRHAPGADATVTIRYTSDSIDFTIDNTRPTSAPVRTGTTGTTGGNGIIGMRERAHALGGALTAGPRPSGGFRVAARLPVRPVASSERAANGRAGGRADSAAGRGAERSAAVSDSARNTAGPPDNTAGPAADSTGRAGNTTGSARTTGNPARNTAGPAGTTAGSAPTTASPAGKIAGLARNTAGPAASHTRSGPDVAGSRDDDASAPGSSPIEATPSDGPRSSAEPMNSANARGRGRNQAQIGGPNAEPQGTPTGRPSRNGSLPSPRADESVTNDQNALAPARSPGHVTATGAAERSAAASAGRAGTNGRDGAPGGTEPR